MWKLIKWLINARNYEITYNLFKEFYFTILENIVINILTFIKHWNSFIATDELKINNNIRKKNYFHSTFRISWISVYFKVLLESGRKFDCWWIPDINVKISISIASKILVYFTFNTKNTHRDMIYYWSIILIPSLYICFIFELFLMGNKIQFKRTKNKEMRKRCNLRMFWCSSCL